jgi:hypothetical protein
MKTIKNLSERIKVENNMVGISQIIMQEVFYNYCNQFATEYRPFNRLKESQEQWTKELFSVYSLQIKLDRNFLVESIPRRFHKTIMYKKLISQI